MSNRYPQRKKRYSRSRSKSWSRDNYNQRERRFKDEYKSYKPRYDEIKVKKDNFKQSQVSIDWKPRANNEKNKHNYKYSRSPSPSSSSSSSSSSSYSSSASKSRRGQKKLKQSWRKRSSERNQYRQRNKSHSRSDSRSNRKKQHNEKQKEYIRDDKKNDNQYRKGQKFEKDTKFEGNYQSYKHPIGGYKASTNYKKHEPTGYYNKYQNDDQKWRENDYKKNTEVKRQWAPKQINDIDNYQNKTKNEDKKEIKIQIAKMPQQQNLKQIHQPNVYTAQTIKRIQPEIVNVIPQKQKISKATQLINESKKNLQITPLRTNFLILDSFRSMKKFNAETLDPTLLSWLHKDFQLRYEQQKTKVFGKQNIISEQRQSARITLPLHPTEEEIELKTQLQMLRGSMLTLNHLFRQLHMLQ